MGTLQVPAKEYRTMKDFTVFKRKRRITKISEVKKLIKGIDDYGLKVVALGIGAKYKSFAAYMAAEGDKWRGLSTHIVIHLKDTQLEITSKYGPELLKPCTYIFNLNGDNSTVTSGLQTFAQLNRWFKIPKASEYNYSKLDKWFDANTGKYACSAKPTLGFNPKFQKMDLTDCYEYDLNSAYFNILLKKVPDLHNPIYNSKVKQNQVGFLLDDQLSMLEGPSKCEADVVFNLIETPQGLKDYCKKWYTIKKTTKDKFEKQTAKDFLNLPIGYSQRYNPFFRAYVVHNCNKVIDNLVALNKSNCLFWNTDAIFTNKPLDDLLKIGTEIGEWKKIEGKRLRYVGNVYQIDDDIPVYRGVPKAWFEAFEIKHKRKYNLLTDSTPPRVNKFEWDWETLSITRRTDWDE